MEVAAGPDEVREPAGPDALRLRSRVVDANDGIIATGGIVEGFAGAGASGSTIVVAALAALIAGSLSLGGAKYSEAAAERDAERALLEEERRRIDLAPDEEHAELATLYEAKGLSPALADEVATELMARDPLAAHADAEYGITGGSTPPLVVAVGSALAFALGSGIPLLTVLLTPNEWRVAVMFVAVVVSLAVTAVVIARAGHTPVLRTILRTVAIGAVTLALSLAGGNLFESTQDRL